VWKDAITYMVMSKEDVESNPYLNSYQEEYQMPVSEANISEFEQYLVLPNGLAEAVLSKARTESPR
jgi:hypothetical protein